MQKSQPARHGPSSYSTTRPADSRAPTSHHWFLHDKDGAQRTSAEVPASRGSNGEGTGASRPARGPKRHRHRHPERTYTAVQRRSSHARELIGLAHAGMDRACYDKPVRAARKHEISGREQIGVILPRPPPHRYTPHPIPPLLPHRSLYFDIAWIPDHPPWEETERISKGWRTWRWWRRLQQRRKQQKRRRWRKWPRQRKRRSGRQSWKRRQ